ncbi:hypothetical protein [Agrobacterium vitis]|uniref:hypothetical protein n=1 Tax=Agrobacterium vitis TaxID=373 RepID=UPI0018D262A1|nr:hypothetical protein [Agrobacterium vitis]
MIDPVLLASAMRTGPFVMPWPTASSPAAILEFHKAEDWVSFLRQRDIADGVPMIVAAKYQRAQRLYALSWLDFDLIKRVSLSR